MCSDCEWELENEEPEPVEQTPWPDGGLDGDCRMGYPGCDGGGTWIIDPYAEDVHNDHDTWILCCGTCCAFICNEI